MDSARQSSSAKRTASSGRRRGPRTRRAASSYKLRTSSRSRKIQPRSRSQPPFQVDLNLRMRVQPLDDGNYSVKPSEICLGKQQVYSQKTYSPKPRISTLKPKRTSSTAKPSRRVPVARPRLTSLISSPAAVTRGKKHLVPINQLPFNIAGKILKSFPDTKYAAVTGSAAPTSATPLEPSRTFPEDMDYNSAYDNSESEAECARSQPLKKTTGGLTPCSSTTSLGSQISAGSGKGASSFEARNKKKHVSAARQRSVVAPRPLSGSVLARPTRMSASSGGSQSSRRSGNGGSSETRIKKKHISAAGQRSVTAQPRPARSSSASSGGSLFSTGNGVRASASETQVKKMNIPVAGAGSVAAQHPRAGHEPSLKQTKGSMVLERVCHPRKLSFSQAVQEIDASAMDDTASVHTPGSPRHLYQSPLAPSYQSPAASDVWCTAQSYDAKHRQPQFPRTRSLSQSPDVLPLNFSMDSPVVQGTAGSAPLLHASPSTHVDDGFDNESVMSVSFSEATSSNSLPYDIDLTQSNSSGIPHTFYHQRVVRLGFIANSVPMAVNVVLNIRSEDEDLFFEPVELLYNDQKLWRRSARAVTKEIEAQRVAKAASRAVSEPDVVDTCRSLPGSPAVSTPRSPLSTAKSPVSPSKKAPSVQGSATKISNLPL